MVRTWAESESRGRVRILTMWDWHYSSMLELLREQLRAAIFRI